MIEVQVNDMFLEMSPGAQLSLNIANPLFADEIGYQSHSYKFSIPATPVNRQALLNPDIALAASPVIRHDAQLWLGGVPWLNGSITVTNVTSGSFSLAFEEDASYRELIENTYIKDLPLEQVQVTGPTSPGAVLTIDLTGVSGDVAAIYIYDTLIWTTFIVGMSEWNVLSNIENEIINSGIPVTPQVVTGGPKDELHLTPTDPDTFFLDLNPPENDHTWNTVSYTSSGQANNTNCLGHINTVGRAAAGTYAYAFPPIKNSLFYGDDPGDYSGFVNLFDPSTKNYQLNSDSVGENYRTAISPQVSVSHILEKVCEFLGLTDISTWTAGTDFQKIYIYNNRPVEREFQGVAWVASTWDLADHVPQGWTIQDFLDALRQFNISIRINSVAKTIELIERRAVKRSNNTDLREKSLTGYAISFGSSDAQYGYEYIQDKTDALYEDVNSFGAISGTEESRKVKAPVAPLFERKSLDPINLEGWLTPEIEQQGYTSSKGLTPFEANPRFFFLLGEQDNANSNTYPTASSTGLDYSGTQRTGFSLYWSGPTGLYVHAYQDVKGWLFSGREISIPMQIDMANILSLDWKKPVFVRVTEGEIPVFWKVLKVSVSRERIENAEIQGAI